MQIKEIIGFLESLAPPQYQESYDNAGLITGHGEMEFTGSICCLDSTEAVIDEAIAKGANLVVAHHPIVFKGLKRFNGRSYVERAIIKAIKHDIAVYAIHTNLDNVRGGVNERIADELGLEAKGRKILIPKPSQLTKLECYVPTTHAKAVQEAIWAAGAGAIGNYDRCAFTLDGKGTFRPVKDADPHTGTIGKQEEVHEIKLEVILPSYLMPQVISALFEAHPYEQPAYQLISLENSDQEVGAGIVGNLTAPMDAKEFLTQLKARMTAGVVKHTALCHEKIEKVAILGGSGVFGLSAAIGSGAQIFITGDVKYHEYFDADGQIILVDIGHYESEQYTQQLLHGKLAEKFPKFAHLLTEVTTNPVHYL